MRSPAPARCGTRTLSACAPRLGGLCGVGPEEEALGRFWGRKARAKDRKPNSRDEIRSFTRKATLHHRAKRPTVLSHPGGAVPKWAPTRNTRGAYWMRPQPSARLLQISAVRSLPPPRALHCARPNPTNSQHQCSACCRSATLAATCAAQAMPVPAELFGSWGRGAQRPSNKRGACHAGSRQANRSCH